MGVIIRNGIEYTTGVMNKMAENQYFDPAKNKYKIGSVYTVQEAIDANTDKIEDINNSIIDDDDSYEAINATGTLVDTYIVKNKIAELKSSFSDALTNLKNTAIAKAIGVSGTTFTKVIEELGTIVNRGSIKATLYPGSSTSNGAGYYSVVSVMASENSETYTYSEGSTGGTTDMGTHNLVRYVNAENVYNKGVSNTKVGTATKDVVLHGYTFTSAAEDTVGESGTMTDHRITKHIAKDSSAVDQIIADGTQSSNSVFRTITYNNNYYNQVVPANGFWGNWNWDYEGIYCPLGGTTTADYVLDGQTFSSNKAGYNIKGTMVNHSSDKVDATSSTESINPQIPFYRTFYENDKAYCQVVPSNGYWGDYNYSNEHINCDVTAIYDNGYSTGNTAGYNTGYTAGYNEGQLAGYNNGLTYGKNNPNWAFKDFTYENTGSEWQTIKASDLGWAVICGVYGNSPYCSIRLTPDTASFSSFQVQCDSASWTVQLVGITSA